jgi:signal transduction histidine kinase/HPt (histidine-containing phosphotransfer) domain-containing protein/FixJ family two-component response regulator
VTATGAVDRELADCLGALGLDVQHAPTNAEWQACLMAISELIAQREDAALTRSRRVVSVLSVQAQSAARVFEAFLATMGHELRTPLSVVVGSLELLGSGATLDPEQRTTLDIARRSALSLTRTIDAILDYCRVEAGELGLVKRPFQLGDAVLGVLERHRPVAEERGVELELAWNPNLPTCVSGDVHRLVQVLDALLDNALKFTERGWVRVSVALERQDEGGTWVRFQVSDTGIGIAPEARERLFLPFRQLDQELSRRHGGIGLGLALTQKLVALMGGQVDVVATLGVGSTFRFSACFEYATLSELPARPSLPASLSTSPQPPTLRPGDGARTQPRHVPPRVLVAEDNEFSRLFIVRALEPLGCEVLSVVDGRRAVEATASFEPDLVFMDVQMPEMDGLTAARKIRNLAEPLNLVPIVALSANAQHGDRARCSDAGMDAFLAKPISVPQLREQVTQWLGAADSPSVVPLSDATAIEELSEAPAGDAYGSGSSAGEGESLLADFAHGGAPLVSSPEAKVSAAGPCRSGLRSDASRLATFEAAAGTLDLARFEELVDQAGSADILRELSEIFVSDITARIELLGQAHAAGEQDSVRRLAHAIKGSSANFGALVVARLAEAIEREPPAASEVDVVDELRAAFAQVRAILDATVLGPLPASVRSSRQVG